jgi:hypothetical protein
MGKKANKSSDFGKQAALARLVGASPNHICQCLSGIRNAGLVMGLQLAWHLKTDARHFGRGGSVAARQAAFEAWTP